MAEATPTPAATGLTLEQIKGVIDAAVAAALKPVIDNQKVIADTMAADAIAKAEAAKTAEAAKADAKKPTETSSVGLKPLTSEDVAKLLNDTLAARDNAAKSSAARDAYIAEKLKGVPAVYQGKLGTDPAKWAAEEQAIRDGLKADLAALGATVKDVGGGNPGGASGSGGSAPAAKPNLNLTPGQSAFAESLKMPA